MRLYIYINNENVFQTPEIILWVLWILWTHLSIFTFSAQNILKQYFRDTASIGFEKMMEEVKNHPDSPPGIRNDLLSSLNDLQCRRHGREGLFETF